MTLVVTHEAADRSDSDLVEVADLRGFELLRELRSGDRVRVGDSVVVVLVKLAVFCCGNRVGGKKGKEEHGRNAEVVCTLTTAAA